MPCRNQTNLTYRNNRITNADNRDNAHAAQ